MKVYYLCPIFVIVVISEPKSLKQEEIESNKTNYENLEFNWNSYNNLNTINQWIRNITTSRKNVEIVRTSEGTYEGREILGVKLDIPSEMFKNKKVIFLESGIYGTERLTPMANLYIFYALLDSRKGEDLNWLAQAYEWYFFPVVCPDGYARNFYMGNQDVHCDSAGHEVEDFDEVESNHLTRGFHLHDDCVGADPNRNWDYNWKDASRLGLETSRCSLDFPGDHVWSEHCVRFTADFIAVLGPRIHAYFSFHQNGPFLIVPYGDCDDHLDNYSDMVKILHQVASDIKTKYGNEYKVGNIKETVVEHGRKKDPETAGIIKRGEISGSSIDWVKRSFTPPIVVQIELPDEANMVFTVAREALDIILGVMGEYDHKFPPECPPCEGACPPWCSFKQHEGVPASPKRAKRKRKHGIRYHHPYG